MTLNDNRDNNYDLWKGTFTITNAAGINITYTVYHTGIFHEITDDMANKYELTEGGVDSLKVKGMFYYGVVKVKGKDHTYIMLDRNLGATDNSPYVPDINEFKTTKVPSVDTSRFQRIRINQIPSMGIYPLLCHLMASKFQIDLSLRT